MSRIKLFSGVALLLTTIASPVMAQSNQSNASGANATNAPGISIGPMNIPAGYSAEVLNQAQQLANQLKAAEQAYQAAEPRPNESGPRRFTRYRKCNCATNPAQAQLDQARANVTQFLDRIKNPTPDLLQPSNSRSAQSW